MSKDLLKLIGFVALSQTTSMAQSLFSSTVWPTAPILNPSAPLTLPTPGSQYRVAEFALAPRPYQRRAPLWALNSSTATSLRTVLSVFGAQSSFAPC
jgi:hypothetical protein